MAHDCGEILWATMDAGNLFLLADRSDCIDRTQAAIQDPGGSDLRQAPYCYMRLPQTGGQAG
jgi:hypothetical protein